MANVLTTNFDYTYPGQLATDVIYKPSVQTPEITQLFTVRPGIKFKQQLMLAGILSNVVKKYTSCDRTFGTEANTLFNRTLEVSELEFNIEQCKDAFEDTIVEEELPEGISEFQLGNYVLRVINNVITDALRRDNFRIFSFGDTTSGSDNYDQLDGLWTKLIAGVADYCVTKVDDITTLNDTAGSTARDYLKNLFEEAPIILKQTPTNLKKFFVTGDIYENLMTYYEDQQFNGGLTQYVENGNVNLRFRGIDVVPVYAWDDALTDTDNPLNGTMTTGIIYTTPQNHVIGVGRAADMGSVNAWYERKDRKMYFEGHYRMGYQYAHCDLQAISYGVVA